MRILLVFDLNGTLTDPAGIGEPWSDPRLGEAVLDHAIRLALTDTVIVSYHPFSDHVEAALRAEVAMRRLDPERVEAALERAQQLDPFPDAAEALDRLRAAGHRLAVLTNSGAESGRATLEAAGLADRFEAILGVDAVERFKPDAAVYEHALRELGAGEATMVAAHAWDITGAKHAGLGGAWIARRGELYPQTGIAPDVTAASLSDLATQLERIQPT